MAFLCLIFFKRPYKKMKTIQLKKRFELVLNEWVLFMALRFVCRPDK